MHPSFGEDAPLQQPSPTFRGPSERKVVVVDSNPWARAHDGAADGGRRQILLDSSVDTADAKPSIARNRVRGGRRRRCVQSPPASPKCPSRAVKGPSLPAGSERESKAPSGLTRPGRGDPALRSLGFAAATLPRRRRCLFGAGP
jgi:hypothetical protein